MASRWLGRYREWEQEHHDAKVPDSRMYVELRRAYDGTDLSDEDEDGIVHDASVALRVQERERGWWWTAVSVVAVLAFGAGWWVRVGTEPSPTPAPVPWDCVVELNRGPSDGDVVTCESE